MVHERTQELAGAFVGFAFALQCVINLKEPVADRQGITCCTLDLCRNRHCAICCL